MNGVSPAAYNPMLDYQHLFMVPLALLLNGARGIGGEKRAPALTIDGVPAAVILSLQNARRGLPMAGKQGAKRRKPNASARAKAQKQAALDRKAWERRLSEAKNWSRARIKAELRRRGLPTLADLGAALGLAPQPLAA
jgi:hypothetical protein